MLSSKYRISSHTLCVPPFPLQNDRNKIVLPFHFSGGKMESLHLYKTFHYVSMYCEIHLAWALHLRQMVMY